MDDLEHYQYMLPRVYVCPKCNYESGGMHFDTCCKCNYSSSYICRLTIYKTKDGFPLYEGWLGTS